MTEGAGSKVGLVVADIFEAVLGCAVVENDNFFELGGDSMRAALAVRRLNRRLGVDLDLSDLFDNPTVADLADVVRRAPARGSSTRATIAGSELQQLSYMQENRFLRLTRAMRDGRSTGQGLVPFGVELRGKISDESIFAAVHSVVRCHEALRTGFSVDAATDTVLPFVVDPGTAEPSIDCVVLHDIEPNVRLKTAEEHLATMTNLPMAIDAPPLLRARVCRFADDYAVLVVLVEHQIFDGRSAEVFRSDLAAALRNPGSPLKASLPMSEWINQHRRFLSSQEGEQALGYWRRALSGTEPYPTLKIPPASAPTDETYAEVVGFLPEAEFAALRRLVGSERATPSIAFLAAIAAAWRACGAGSEAVVHFPCDNRSGEGTERLIGWLAHSLILRVQLDASTTWREAIQCARNVAVSAYDHQAVPFPLVVRTLQADMHGTPTRTPRLFGSYQPHDDVVEKVPGGELCLMPPSERASFADVGLAFRATEQGGGLRLATVYDPRGVDHDFAAGVHQALVAAMRQMATDLDGSLP